EVTKKFIVKATAISASAKAKIEAAGGSVELIPSPSRAGKKPKTADEK
ncbi:MAG: mitochondrial large ribosomal subunit protein uL15m, partial [bacterium]|nr:mitochondrial large ribosomal subunit protein uL15m [bacterium]